VAGAGPAAADPPLMICVNDPGEGGADEAGGADGGGPAGGVLGSPAMSRVNSPGCASPPSAAGGAVEGFGGAGGSRRGGPASCKARR